MPQTKIKSKVLCRLGCDKNLHNIDKMSCGASLFNYVLVFLGVRGPFQTLYHPQEQLSNKLQALLRPCRLYSLCIFGCLFILPLKYVTDLTDSYNDETFILLASEALLPLQYFLSVYYFGSTHVQCFYDVMKPAKVRLNKRERLSLSNIKVVIADIQLENKNETNSMDNFDQLIKQPCKFTIGIITIIILLLLLLTLTGSLLSSEFSIHEMHFPFFVISRLFGRGTCILNTTTFSFIFYKHVKVLLFYAEVLEQRNWSDQNYDRVSTMLVNFTRIRESLKIATNMTKSMYSSASVAGGIIIGSLLHSRTVSDAYIWRYETFVILGSFFLLQSLVFMVIAQLSMAKDKIEDVAKSSKFAMQFLARRAGNDSEVALFENASSIDYRLFIDMLNEKWLDFSVMGIPIHSLSFLKQCFSFASILLVLTQTGKLNMQDFI